MRTLFQSAARGVALLFTLLAVPAPNAAAMPPAVSQVPPDTIVGPDSLISHVSRISPVANADGARWLVLRNARPDGVCVARCHATEHHRTALGSLTWGFRTGALTQETATAGLTVDTMTAAHSSRTPRKPTPLAPWLLLPFAGALSKSRDTKARGVVWRRSHPLGASAKIYQGSLVVIDAGYAVAGSTDTGLVAAGRACQDYDNTGGGAGAVIGEFEVGEFKFKNSASGDLIAQADVGADCYIVDDETVAKTSNSAARSRAGKITGVDSDGVWVLIGIPF